MAEADPRSKAVERIEQKRAFQKTLLGFVAVSALLIVIWAVSGAGFFWPAFPIAGLTIAAVFQAIGTYGRSKPITDEEVDAEMRRGGGA